MTDRTAELTHGMIAVTADAAIATDGTDITIDFDPRSPVACTINGDSFDAPTVEDLAGRILERYDGSSMLSLPLTVAVTTSRLTLTQPSEVTGDRAGALLSGPAVQGAIDKAEALTPTAPGSWLPEVDVGDAEYELLDALVAGDRWDGPLVASMPRTGSTLLGMLFLLLRDPPGSGDYVFDRYIHEPAAPLYWQGRDVASIGEIITRPLTPGDVIQESAYQFSDRRLARWFLGQARRPVIFPVRHPQISWPSRYRILLRMRLESDPDRADAPAIRHALETQDFSDLGDLLTTLTPPDNGWLALLSLIQCCIEDDIEFVIVDNSRFRRHPEAVLRQLCSRLGLTYDSHLTEWRDLSEIRDRVVMGELAQGEEYEHYYRRTIDSSAGIVADDHDPLPLEMFPPELRGHGGEHVTVEEAATWYQMLIARPEAIRV